MIAPFANVKSPLSINPFYTIQQNEQTGQTNKQTNNQSNQTNKQTNKQTKQTNKQTNKTYKQTHFEHSTKR
jgi:hypothetical protein